MFILWLGNVSSGSVSSGSINRAAINASAMRMNTALLIDEGVMGVVFMRVGELVIPESIFYGGQYGFSRSSQAIPGI